jgi:undecaprenyl-diphosphatase
MHMEWIKYIILGIVQGIAEILPISSSGHLTILSHLFQLDLTHLSLFLMMTNTGSFLAILLFFKHDVLVLFQNSVSYVFKKSVTGKDDFYYVVKLVIAIVPVGIAGLLLEDYFPSSLLIVGFSLLVTGSLLLYVYRSRNFEFQKTITYKNAFVVGLFQMFAILPGISRSGITISGGVLQKISLKDTLKFSFLSYILISIPVTLLGFLRMGQNAESINIVGYLLATILSFVFSYLAVYWLYKFVRVKNLYVFSIYCFIVGLIAIVLHFT